MKERRERGGGNPSFPRARRLLLPASGEPIFLAAAISLASRASLAAKKRNPFLFPGIQARGRVLHAEGQAPYPVQASKRMKTASRGPGRGRYKEPNASFVIQLLENMKAASLTCMFI
jgi:hypothetical protein